MGVLQTDVASAPRCGVSSSPSLCVHSCHAARGNRGKGDGRGFCSPWPSGAIGNPPTIEPPVCAGPPCLIPQPTGRGLNIGLYPDHFQSF